MHCKKAVPQFVVPIPKKVVSIDPNQKSFRVPQCARYTGLTDWQVRMAIWEGRLSARRVGKSLVILRTDADKFLENLSELGNWKWGQGEAQKKYPLAKRTRGPEPS